MFKFRSVFASTLNGELIAARMLTSMSDASCVYVCVCVCVHIHVCVANTWVCYVYMQIFVYIQENLERFVYVCMRACAVYVYMIYVDTCE